MTAQPENPFDLIRSFIQNSTVRQLTFLIGVAASVALGMMLYFSIQEPTYKPIDYQVNSRNIAAISDALDKANIAYKVNSNDGLLYVAANDAQMARIKLAAAGIAKDDSFNFSYLNEQSTLGNNQFVENTRYALALEHDLAKTISGIEGISAAKIHLAMPANNVFADENRRPTASVVLNLAPGFSSNKEKIRAVMQIVASSVPGLDPKDVAITDQYGHYLSDAMDPDSIFNQAQLNYQANMEREYEKRIQSMIAPMLGNNSVNVRVHANVDFTQAEEAKEEYDPDQKVVRSEKKMSQRNSSGGAGGAAGALNNAPPEGGAAAGGGGGHSSESDENVKNYDIGKKVSYKKSNSAKIINLSVAVVVGNESITNPDTKEVTNQAPSAQKIQQINDLVKATVGYNEARGDKVTVVNSVLNPIDKIEPLAPVAFYTQPWFWDMSKKTLGILLGFGFLFFLYRRLAAQYRAAQEKSKKPQSDLQNIINLNDLKQEHIDQLKELAKREPHRVSAILKTWMNK